MELKAVPTPGQVVGSNLAPSLVARATPAVVQTGLPEDKATLSTMVAPPDGKPESPPLPSPPPGGRPDGAQPEGRVDATLSRESSPGKTPPAKVPGVLAVLDEAAPPAVQEKPLVTAASVAAVQLQDSRTASVNRLRQFYDSYDPPTRKLVDDKADEIAGQFQQSYGRPLDRETAFVTAFGDLSQWGLEQVFAADPGLKQRHVLSDGNLDLAGLCQDAVSQQNYGVAIAAEGIMHSHNYLRCGQALRQLESPAPAQQPLQTGRLDLEQLGRTDSRASARIAAFRELPEANLEDVRRELSDRVMGTFGTLPEPQKVEIGRGIYHRIEAFKQASGAQTIDKPLFINQELERYATERLGQGPTYATLREQAQDYLILRNVLAQRGLDWTEG